MAGDSRLTELAPQSVRAENCTACLSGEQHPSHVLYGRHNGRRFAVYVPEDLMPQVRRAVENGRALQASQDRNLPIVAGEAPNDTTRLVAFRSRP